VSAVLTQQVAAGLVLGSLYALLALGLAMVYGVLRILHVAHAGVFAAGAYAALVTAPRVGAWGGVAAAVGVCAVGGLFAERFIYRPLLDQPPLVPLIASIGLFILVEDLLRLVFGPYIQAFPIRPPLQGLEVAGVRLTGNDALILATTALLLGGLYLLLHRTTLGLAWRAVASDLEVARMMGINTNRVVALNLAVGSALAGIAGVLVALYYNQVYPTMGSVVGYKALAIIVLGGLGSVLGTAAAGLLLGVVESLLVAQVGFVLPRDAIAFIALILVLLARPRGLVGGSA
jgi:branched-chain amino acid transport system permease protein